MLGMRFGGECKSFSNAPKECEGFEGERAAQCVPLAFARVGSDVLVSYVRGAEQRHHLENLGFVEGSRVRVVSETGGNLVVEVKGTQVALDRRIAMKIFTTV